MGKKQRTHATLPYAVHKLSQTSTSRRAKFAFPNGPYQLLEEPHFQLCYCHFRCNSGDASLSASPAMLSIAVKGLEHTIRRLCKLGQVQRAPRCFPSNEGFPLHCRALARSPPSRERAVVNKHPSPRQPCPDGASRKEKEFGIGQPPLPPPSKPLATSRKFLKLWI